MNIIILSVLAIAIYISLKNYIEAKCSASITGECSNCNKCVKAGNKRYLKD